MSAPYYEDDLVTLYHGDCLDVLATLPDASVDSIVTDPPYGLEFMGREWDGANGFRRSLNPADAGRDNAFGRTSRTSPEYRTDSAFQEWCEAWATECLRVLKPGGHLLAFGGTRTWHRLACAVEDAGFEVRDSLAWLYGSGFPKSMDVPKAIDKARLWLGPPCCMCNGTGRDRYTHPEHGDNCRACNGHGRGPSTGEDWQGWGTALKPAFEPIVVARKPLSGTVAANVLAHGTGALNIDGCRVGDGEGVVTFDRAERPGHEVYQGSLGTVTGVRPSGQGRWPANVILDESQAEALDEQSGETVSNVRTPSGKDDRGAPNTASQMVMRRNDTDPRGVADSGGASRFFPVFKEDDSCTDTTTPAASAPTLTATGAPDATHAPDTTTPSGASSAGDSGATTDLPIELMVERFRYVAKADASERVRVDGIAHPTVKPLTLMRWLVRLVTPPGGTVLEPFAGSGTTVEACILEGFKCIAIEREADYLPLIQQRIDRRRDPVAAVKATGDDGGLFDLLDPEAS